MKRFTIHSNKLGDFNIKVDDGDYELLKNYRWMINLQRGTRPYACRWMGSGHSQRRFISLHRWLMGDPSGMVVDHINGDTLDNRRSNLRVCTNAANLRNGGLRKTNKSGHRGVCKINGRWWAYIGVNSRMIKLGYFKTYAEAVEARRLGEVKYWSV